MCKTIYKNILLLSGDSILVHPVTRSGATDEKVYFPGDDTLWYEIEDYKVYKGPGYQTIPVSIEKVKCLFTVFQITI